jgi:uncharacterized protein with LGFP repeats
VFSVRRLRAPRSLLVAVAVAVTLPVLWVPGIAAADDEVATGDTVVGEFVQVWQEYEDPETAVEHADGALLSYVRTESAGTVRLDTDDVEDLPVGATVELTVGRTVADQAATEEGLDKAREVLAAEVLEAAPVPTAPAEIALDLEVTVVMVTPAGGVQDATILDEVVQAVDGPVAEFWWEQGRRRVGVVDAHDWITTAADCSDPFALWDEVAEEVGFVQTHYQHLLLYVTSAPDDLDCAYGLGTVGSTTVDGGYAYVRDTLPSVIAHELGHNISLKHSSARQCDGTVETGTCETVPYADYYDVMGFSWSELGSLSMAQASRLPGLLPEWDKRSIYEGSPAQSVTLAPVSSLSGLRAIELWGGPGKSYWLEYRPASGRDSWIGVGPGAGLQAGVQLRHIPGTADNWSLLLDGTPSAEENWADDLGTALPVDTPIRLANGMFTVTVRSVGPSSATVEVSTLTAIGRAHEQLGGDGGSLGAPTAAEACAYLGATYYCQRSYQHGEIYWDVYSGKPPVAIRGGLYPAWIAAGGLSTWGLPTSTTTCGLAAGGCSQTFVGAPGTVYWSSATGLVASSGGIRSYWLANGGPAGLLGYPNGELTCGSTTCQQSFQGGTIVWSAARGNLAVQGPIRDAWVAAGGGAGALGQPTTAMGCGMVGGGCGQQFEKGSLYWTSTAGAHAVTGAIWSLWVKNGWERGPMGYASGDVACGFTGGGCKQPFTGGTATWSPATGARFTSGAIGAAWTAGGQEAGPLGYPSTPMGCGMVSSGCGQQFQGGSVYWTATAGAHAVTGPIWGLWTRTGWERGPLRYASGDMQCGLAAGGCRQAFQGGTATWSAATGAQFTNGAIGAAWVAGGREAGALGYPSLPMGCGLPASGCGQQFQGGSVYWTPTAGAHAVTGPIWGLWTALGWERGPLRYASGDLLCGLTAGGCRQAFQGGTATWSAATGAQFTNGAIGAAWAAGGREAGALGYPLLPMGCGMVSSGCGQQFQNGSVYWTPTAGAHAVTGPIWQYWMDSGWERGPLGYATTDLDCTLAGGGCRQDFTGGSVFWSAGTGAHATYGAVRAQWLKDGAEDGALGYPDGEMTCGPSSCSQSFENGTAVWSPAAGVQVVKGAILGVWTATGGDTGPLKGALAAATCGLTDSGCRQSFQGGEIASSTASGAWATYGAIRSFWRANGAEDGDLGYPTGEMTCGPGSCSQAFQRATVEWTPASGARTVV